MAADDNQEPAGPRRLTPGTFGGTVMTTPPDDDDLEWEREMEELEELEQWRIRATARTAIEIRARYPNMPKGKARSIARYALELGLPIGWTVRAHIRDHYTDYFARLEALNAQERAYYARECPAHFTDCYTPADDLDYRCAAQRIAENKAGRAVAGRIDEIAATWQGMVPAGARLLRAMPLDVRRLVRAASRNVRRALLVERGLDDAQCRAICQFLKYVRRRYRENANDCQERRTPDLPFSHAPPPRCRPCRRRRR